MRGRNSRVGRRPEGERRWAGGGGQREGSRAAPQAMRDRCGDGSSREEVLWPHEHFLGVSRWLVQGRLNCNLAFQAFAML